MPDATWPGAFQSTRPSRGETLPYQGRQFSLEISIHSPLAGRDRYGLRWFHCHTHFNPLAPRGARHHQRGGMTMENRISIHSPLAGRDVPAAAGCRGNNHNFNPLAPRGARPIRTAMVPLSHAFQSTRPSRGETSSTGRHDHGKQNFNPLAPRGARPKHRPRGRAGAKHFNPLAPRGARQAISSAFIRCLNISIHSPLAGRDMPRVVM